jgi:hypothetical protein
MKAKQKAFLLDQLANSMEFYDEIGFVNHIHEETGLDKHKLRSLFSAYFKTNPLEREKESVLSSMINKAFNP